MKRFWMFLISSLFVAAYAPDSPQPSAVETVPAGPPAISDRGRAALDEFLRASVADGRVPKVVAMAASSNEVMFQGAYGKQSVADDIDVGVHSIFNLASMTKPVTSVATMMLAEEGAFDLDDPVSMYLPDLAGRDVVTEVDEDAGIYRTEPADSERVRLFFVVSHPAAPDPRIDETSILCRP